MVPRFVTWIWHVRGSLPLAPDQSGSDALDRLDPLFHQEGTSHERTDDTLFFRKKDQAAQDRMSVFDAGVLRIERRAAGPVLRYDLTSRALLFCFLAPLLFLGFAQLTKVVVLLEKHEASGKADGAKKDAKKEEVKPLNPIDKFLGAPAPEAKKHPKKGKAGGDADEGGKKKPSSKPGYVFAAIFAVLYIIGRILEDRLVRSLFRKTLLNP